MVVGEVLRETWAALHKHGNVPTGRLAACLEVTKSELRQIPVHYRTFVTKKRTKGHRRISIPNPALKRIQRRIHARFLRRCRCHQAVHGFVTGRSIVSNASVHVGRSVVMRIDIKEFFPSTSKSRVHNYFLGSGWDAEAANLLCKLCTLDDGLPQGAPTSPSLSNLVNYRMDARIEGLCKKHNVAYTRYADDVTLSLPADNADLISTLLLHVGLIFRDCGYAPNVWKTRVMRRHQQQNVTGLVVNDFVQLPRKTRRWLRAVKHHMDTDRCATIERSQYEGWAALQKMIVNQSRSMDS